MSKLPSPAEAWKPLSRSRWDREAARHLAIRLGFSIHPKWVQKVYRQGAAKAINTALQNTEPFPAPETVQQWIEFSRSYYKKIDNTHGEERTSLQRQRNQLRRDGMSDLYQAWLRSASDFDMAPREKLVLFLQNVWVVQSRVVTHPPYIYEHQAAIRDSLTLTYPQMCKALSRSPAMVIYLDLARNRKGAPNENFARELFELFILGEGNYTENDIKEASRAFTGRAISNYEIIERAHHFDSTPKTIFGHTAEMDGDAVIDLAFQQPAARTFLPAELVRHYLSHEPLPPQYLESLGDIWQAADFSLPTLFQTFFRSRLFYHPSFRAKLIKSPVEFYCGLLQDLELPLAPIPPWSQRPLKAMGQEIFNPPNVSGWTGGTAWIHSAAWMARQQLIQRLLEDPFSRKLNADVELALTDFGKPVSLTAERIPQWWKNGRRKPSKQVIRGLCNRLLQRKPSPQTIQVLQTTFDEAEGDFDEKLWVTLNLLLQTPEYHLC